MEPHPQFRLAQVFPWQILILYTNHCFCLVSSTCCVALQGYAEWSKQETLLRTFARLQRPREAALYCPPLTILLQYYFYRKISCTIPAASPVLFKFFCGRERQLLAEPCHRYRSVVSICYCCQAVTLQQRIDPPEANRQDFFVIIRNGHFSVG